MSTQISNALIQSTPITIERGQWLVIGLSVKIGYTSTVIFGGSSTYSNKFNGPTFTGKLMFLIMSVAGVTSWDKLPGTVIRVEHDSEYNVIAIGHAIEDKWFKVSDVWGEGE